MKWVILAGLLVCGVVQADNLVLHLATNHISRDETLNESNRGLGYESYNWEAGFFENSYKKTSAYVGGIYRVENFSLSAGVIDHPEYDVYYLGKLRFGNVAVGMNHRVMTLQLVIPFR